MPILNTSKHRSTYYTVNRLKIIATSFSEKNDDTSLSVLFDIGLSHRPELYADGIIFTVDVEVTRQCLALARGRKTTMKQDSSRVDDVVGDGRNDTNDLTNRNVGRNRVLLIGGGK